MEDILAWGFTCAGVGWVVVAVIVLGPHVYRIFRPRIITYPWNEETQGETSTSRKEHQRTIVFAASYNPPHYGHLRMLEHLSKRYTKVIAVVGFNPNKKYLVSPEERADLLRDMLKKSTSAGENVQVAVVDGYIWRYAKRVGATLFFRGIRSWEKDGNDERILQILNTWGPVLYGPLFIPIPTVYIEGDPKYNHVSSTLIRRICSTGNASGEHQQQQSADEQKKNKEASLSELVPSHVAGKVAKLYDTNK
mmetsp:Transcript_5676/g.12391  ORF Transcript_5676/g.12391 Transcript_5676/m.12391 type:complete len:250 (-) Transcript_5676:58-807(-)